MDRREACLKQASICRQKAQSDPERYDYWMDEAAMWLQRAEESGGAAITHEVHDGRMIPKPPK